MVLLVLLDVYSADQGNQIKICPIYLDSEKILSTLGDRRKVRVFSELLDCELYQIIMVGCAVNPNPPVAISDRPVFAATSSSRFHTTTCQTSALVNQNRFIES